jgi:type IV pilus assembly protein PilW
MHKTDFTTGNLYRRCHGFSLVELMVALVITLILLAGIGQIYLSSKKSFTIQETLGHQQENARYAVEVIAQDARRSSYWGGNADIKLISGTEGMTTDDGTCNASDNSWGRMLDRPIFGKNNTNADYDCISDYYKDKDDIGSDILVVRYQAPWQIGSETTPNYCDDKKALYTCSDDVSPQPPSDCNRLYLRSALTATGEALGRLYRGKAACDGANKMDLDASNPPAPSERVAELIAHAYYVGLSKSIKCRVTGDYVPSLFRVSLDKEGHPTPEEVATGIEKFDVQYGVDTVPASKGDGSVDSYVNAGSVSDWSKVIAIRYWLLTRAQCPETGYTNDTTYTLADEVYSPPDGYRRQLYSTTVMLRNR